jgi:hypothetical protein
MHEQLFRGMVTGQPWWWDKVRGGWSKTILASESLAVKQIGELVELNDGVSEFTSFESSIEVVVAYP